MNFFCWSWAEVLGLIFLMLILFIVVGKTSLEKISLEIYAILEETEIVGKYMIRPILSLKRLTLDEAQGQVVYQYGKHSFETESMDYP